MKHNFTTQQKIKIYKCAIVELKEQFQINWDDSRIALCTSLGNAARGLFGIHRTTSYDEDFKANFPEVWRYKPSHCFNYRYWFSRSNRGINKRIQILETVIQQLENGKQTEN